MCVYLKVARLWLAAAVAAALVSSAPAAGSYLQLPGVPGEEVTAPASVLACGAGEWACADRSRCVPAAWRCDTHTHCPDASDEIGCVFPNTTCSGGQFRCAHSGLCIAATWRCDGEDDCGPHDNSDEDVYMCNKDLKCPANSARCATPEGGHFQCVPVGAFCDGKRDCRDGSDEWDQCAKYSSESCADLNCARGCRATLSGLACFCEPGFEPHDGRCDDTDECSAGGYCAQLCYNNRGGYTCACARGYRALGALGQGHGVCSPVNGHYTRYACA